MERRYDIILVTGEPYADHPFSGVGIIKKVLEDKGFSVGIVETPRWDRDDDFKKLGKPRLFFGVTSGSMDSLLLNYTPLKKKRVDDEFSRMSYRVPDRAVIVYCNMLRKLFKETPLVIAGPESSLRRFAHYDYWDNRVRRSILPDSRADILVYGWGELQAAEIARRLDQKLDQKEGLEGIPGTCIILKTLPPGATELPPYETVIKDPLQFCRMQTLFNNNALLAQKHAGRYVVQFPSMPYTSKDLDYIYSLSYSRRIPSHYPEFRVVEWSVLTHRGCFGACNFCSIHANSGKLLISRSMKSILDEVRYITTLPGFSGTIEFSGASANMYGMDCAEAAKCSGECMSCSRLDTSHHALITLLREARKIPGVQKIVIRSGVRYDLALKSPPYMRELIAHHCGRTLMIAPEHLTPSVLQLMNKHDDHLSEFIDLFQNAARREKKYVELSYYLMVGHPGCTVAN
ncbi:YgiQ family radical SAM protein, partial [Candidatus Woesearchaeota archaeon CG_4_10_14_0_8_um_filter_47_5]